MTSVAVFLTPIGHHGNRLMYDPGRLSGTGRLTFRQLVVGPGR
jgi:hypothetical protein